MLCNHRPSVEYRQHTLKLKKKINCLLLTASPASTQRISTRLQARSIAFCLVTCRTTVAVTTSRYVEMHRNLTHLTTINNITARYECQYLFIFIQYVRFETPLPADVRQFGFANESLRKLSELHYLNLTRVSAELRNESQTLS